MPRKNEPWFWEARKEWCVKIGGVRYRLGSDKKQAQTEFHELMASKGKVVVQRRKLTVGELFERVLNFTKANRSAKTDEWYEMFLQGFINFLKKRYSTNAVSRLRASEVQADDVQAWLDESGWGPSTKRGAVTAVRRAFNFGVKTNILDRSPIMGVEKPEGQIREKLITPVRFKQILKAAKDENFKDVLRIIWLTGCRPQEACRVTAANVQEGTWVFERINSKGKKRRRVVFLNAEAKRISEKWAQRNALGPIFRNLKGTPWTAMTFNNRFCKIQEKIGEKIFMYALRHSYAHHGLTKGKISPEVMAHLLGHSDTTQIYKTYGHLLKDQEFMRRAAAQARR